MLAYLSGPIEFAQDGGQAWRRNLAPFLRDALGHRVYDPAEDEQKNLTEDEVANFRSWKTSDPNRFRDVIRKIINFDLDLIENQADYIVCYWDGSGAQSGGTSAEITVALRKRIPVYLVTALPVEQVSGWMLGCCDQVFATIKELKEFLVARYAPSRIQADRD
jgi:nucleoside 2-deoxyribosyltransferase